MHEGIVESPRSIRPGSPGTLLYTTMNSAPAAAALSPFVSNRQSPRETSAIEPSIDPDGNGLQPSGSPASPAKTTGRGPTVDSTCCPLPSRQASRSGPLRRSKPRANRLLWLAFPTATIHGALPGEPTVPRSGPPLPAEVTGRMPASRAAPNARAMGSDQGSEGEEPIE